MKKAIALVLIGLTVAAVFFFGCSGKTTEESPETGWAALDSEAREEVCDNYNSLRDAGVDDTYILNDLITRQGIDSDAAWAGLQIMQREC